MSGPIEIFDQFHVEHHSIEGRVTLYYTEGHRLVEDVIHRRGGSVSSSARMTTLST